MKNNIIIIQRLNILQYKLVIIGIMINFKMLSTK